MQWQMGENIYSIRLGKLLHLFVSASPPTLYLDCKIFGGQGLSYYGTQA